MYLGTSFSLRAWIAFLCAESCLQSRLSNWIFLSDAVCNNSRPDYCLSSISNTKVICIIFYTVFHMESFQYLHDNGYMQFNQGRMCFPLTTKIHYTHPNHVLQSLYGPFRLTISLRMKSYTKIQSSTQSLIPPLVNQFMQLLYYRSPFCADVYKTAR